MGLAVQVLPNFNSSLIRVLISPQLQAPKPSTVKISRIHLHPSCSVGCKRTQNLAVTRSRGTEQEQGSSSSEEEVCSSPSSDEIDNVNTSHTKLKAMKAGHDHYASSVRMVALWVCTAVAFGIGLGFKDGVGKASEFFAGYLLEQSLSVDNLFVFVLIFKYFKVPHMYQSRVLSYGIAGAIIFRLSIILLGTATLQRFEAVNLFLAIILLYSSLKVLFHLWVALATIVPINLYFLYLVE